MFYFWRGLGSAIGIFSAGFFLLRRFTPFSAEGAVAVAYLLGLLAFLCGVGGWRAFASWLSDSPEPRYSGWRRYWSFTTDHKVVGVQYLVISAIIFLVAGTMALIMRFELAQPGLQFLSHEHYNTVMGLHGIGMTVVALVAIVGGLGNYLVPLMIGAEDMAFPRLNALSFWMLPCGVLILLSSPFVGGFDFGWTAYAPLASRGVMGKLFFLLAFLTVGFSSIFGAVNTVTTVVQLRAQGMTYYRLPIFVWAVLSASIIVLLGTSVVASGLLMTVFDRVIGSSFFDPSRGGNVLMYQHLFWYYSHPAVYIMILPAFGIVLEILPVFARKPLFAYPVAATSLVAIVVVSFVVWAHHMFVSGMYRLLNFPFMVTTELISVPTGIVFLSILGTLWMSKIRLETPMLWVVGWIYNFLIGGLTGIFLADVPTDLHMHDTWFVMAHFHFTIVGGAITGLFAGCYYWFPKISGKMYDETLCKLHFWLFMIGFNVTFIPMFWLGSHGMRRRVADYPAVFSTVQFWITACSLLIAAAIVVFFYNLCRSARRGRPAEDNPWKAKTLEWTTTSPPPLHNFSHPPVVDSAPYGYGETCRSK